MDRFMNAKTVLLMIAILALASACSSPAQPAQEATATVPAAVDSSDIISEGRLEPVRYAEIAFTASGVVSDVLVKEGEPVTKGQPLIHLGDESDTNYAAAQLELVSAQKALNDLQNSAGTDLAQAVIDLKIIQCFLCADQFK